MVPVDARWIVRATANLHGTRMSLSRTSMAARSPKYMVFRLQIPL